MDTIQLKKQILAAMRKDAESKANAFKARMQDAQERANEAEGAMQSRYSTFKEESQYLAGALRSQHEEYLSIVRHIDELLQAPIRAAEKVLAISLVELLMGEESTKRFFVFPHLGGEQYGDYTVLSPKTPLGRSILGKSVGDEFEFTVGDKKTKGEIVSVE